jgi:hypothetical protein
MAERKRSTVERLREGNLTREQRQKRGGGSSPPTRCWNSHLVTRPGWRSAAGVILWQCHRTGTHTRYQSFGSWTAAWQERGGRPGGRKARQIQTVSVPTTGVYGVVLCDVREGGWREGVGAHSGPRICRSAGATCRHGSAMPRRFRIDLQV